MIPSAPCTSSPMSASSCRLTLHSSDLRDVSLVRLVPYRTYIRLSSCRSCSQEKNRTGPHLLYYGLTTSISYWASGPSYHRAASTFSQRCGNTAIGFHLAAARHRCLSSDGQPFPGLPESHLVLHQGHRRVPRGGRWPAPGST